MIVLLAMWVELILGQGEDDLESNRNYIITLSSVPFSPQR